MIKVRYCILGAGPSGLTFAHQLKKAGLTSFVVLEKEQEAGGLCRSVSVDGSPLDIGGGHFLDVRQTEVLEFLFEFMPRREWHEHKRISKIKLRGNKLDHPLEANLWQMNYLEQIDFLESIAQAGCVNNTPMPEKFSDWISWKLGSKIAEEYMLPYNRKMWCMELEKLGTYWLHKLPDVSFRQTLQSCLTRQATGELPAHGTFLYPKKFGYGEVWRRMAAALGDNYLKDTPVTSIDPINRIVNAKFHYDKLITTIPWRFWQQWGALPETVDRAVSNLVHTSIDVDYFPENQLTRSHWTYEPSEVISYHRLLLRQNFCAGSRGYWTETNAKRAMTTKGFRHRNEYAYPVNTIGKPADMKAIYSWTKTLDILPLGRWGTWEHMNSDIAVSQALKAASKILNA